MELFYNPERMSETEIKETFVAYQWVVDEIVSILKHQPKGAGVQHVVIVAPRGMGKTTLLLMLRFTVLSQNLAKRWQPVLFPEESYSVYDLADLWIEVLDHISSETGDAALHEEIKNLKAVHPNSENLEAVALASIKDWRDKNKKRLLLLVDNFDMILEQIGDEKDNASLRDVLMNDGTMMLVGGSTTFFKEARAYDQPLYNLFKIYNLNGLDSDQMEDLLRRRAKIDGLANFEEILRANRTRLRVLEYFTGGNPRLVLMLYRVLTHSDISEVRRGLEKLLDEVTPYYKAKIEALPPQQRKILDQIARISAQTREGLTPTEIANATRLAVNQVSSQLKRLADVGYVRTANIRGRSSYYTLSEPLYAIWHQMRFGRDVRTRMNWLIAFLKGWYDAKELDTECQRLQDLFRLYLTSGREKDARDALEHRRYLMEAIEDQQSRVHTFEGIVLSYLDLRDTETLKHEVLKDAEVNELSPETHQRLIAAGLLTEAPIKPEERKFNQTEFDAGLNLASAALEKGQFDEVSRIFAQLEDTLPPDSPARFLLRAHSAFFVNNTGECLSNLENFLEKQPQSTEALRLKARALRQASRLEEAADTVRRALEIQPDFETWFLLAKILEDLGKNEESLAGFDQSLLIKPDSVDALQGRARRLGALKRFDEALSSMDLALSLDPHSVEGWHDRGLLLANSGNGKEALNSFERANQLRPDSYDLIFAKTLFAVSFKEREEGFRGIDALLKLDSESADAHFLKAYLLLEVDFEQSVSTFRQAFALDGSLHQVLTDSVEGKFLKIVISLLDGELEQIRSHWQDLILAGQQEPDKTALPEWASNAIRLVASDGHWELARQLISSSPLQEQLFPMARALDYLVQGDESSIEKLSPEVRTIVVEIVETLKNARNSSNMPRKKVTKAIPPRKSKAKRKLKGH